MQSKLVDSIRIVILIICILGIGHEIYLTFSYDPNNLQKNPITISLYFFLIFIGVIYDRTTFFSGSIIKIRRSIFWGGLVIFIFILLLMYAVLFGDYPSHSRIHKMAPFNVVLMFFLFFIASLAIFGEHHLGIVNRIKSNGESFSKKRSDK